jgi:hypothetical protein
MGKYIHGFCRGFTNVKRGSYYLYVVVDRFNKMCILMPCKKKIIVEQIANLLFQYVWVQFELPTSIIYDRDTRFLGDFGTRLWRMIDTKLKRIIVFHPRNDGKREVVNQIVVFFLRGYCNKHPKLWDEHIPYVQHAYNRALHFSTQCSPFETCFGYLPKVPLDLMYGRDVDSIEERKEDRACKFIQRIQQVYQEVREQLEKIEAQYKPWHEKHRVDHQFQVGDQVWLHISNERLKGEGKKLKLIRYGSFTILEKSSTNVFHLYLPPYMQNYLVVNVENFKLFEPPVIMDRDEEVSIPSTDEFYPK